MSSTDDAAAVPVGSHGGAYAGLRAVSRVQSIGQDAPVFDRVSVALTLLATRDSSVSGSYTKATYRYAELSVDYLLYGDANGTGWKPVISLSRARGTNRPANEPHVDKSSIAFKLSYRI